MIATSPRNIEGRKSKYGRTGDATETISFIHAEEFEQLTPELVENQTPEQIFQSDSEATEFENTSSTGNRLLTPAGERHFFRQLNYYKYLASKAIIAPTGTRPSMAQEAAKTWLQRAEAARTVLVESNLRLVMGVARKFARSDAEFDEFVSEGNLILVNAIDKFDYTRGFRLSTYATHAVQRHFFRLLKRRQRRKTLEVLSPNDVLSQFHGEESEDNPIEPEWIQFVLSHFKEWLNARERTILTKRFGLDGKPEATLQSLAQHVGLSKERVRQLQVRAIEKIRTLMRKSHSGLHQELLYVEGH